MIESLPQQEPKEELRKQIEQITILIKELRDLAHSAKQEILERKRDNIVARILDTNLSYDEQLKYLRSVGVGTTLPSESKWLELLGLRTGALVGVEAEPRTHKTVSEAGRLLNIKLGADIKAYAWYKTADGADHIVGANLDERRLETSVRVISRYDEAGLTYPRL